MNIYDIFSEKLFLLGFFCLPWKIDGKYERNRGNKSYDLVFFFPIYITVKFALAIVISRVFWTIILRKTEEIERKLDDDSLGDSFCFCFFCILDRILLCLVTEKLRRKKKGQSSRKFFESYVIVSYTCKFTFRFLDWEGKRLKNERYLFYSFRKLRISTRFLKKFLIGVSSLK